MATLTVDEVQEALTNVIDPELGLDFVELGLIYGVEIEGSDVLWSFTRTAPAQRASRLLRGPRSARPRRLARRDAARRGRRAAGDAANRAAGRLRGLRQ